MNKQDIAEKIDKMKSLEDRAVLKELFRQVLEGMIEYQEKEYASFRKEIASEIKLESNQWRIASAVIEQEQYEEKEDWLQPVLEEDKEKILTDWEMVKKCLQARQKVIINRVFFMLGKEEIERIRKEKRTFRGLLYTNKRVIEVKVELQQYMDYIYKLEELKTIFRKNEIPWKSVNDAYFMKFFHVVVTDSNEMISENENIQKIEIDYEEIHNKVKPNYILLWNLYPEIKKSIRFPVPQVNQKVYKFPINIGEKKMPWLVSLKENEYLVRKETEMEIVSPYSTMQEWKCYGFKQDKITAFSIDVPILQNGSREDFVTCYKNQYGKMIRTRADLENRILAMQVEEFIRFEELEIMPPKEKKQEYMVEIDQPSDLHHLVKEKPVMLLKFFGTGQEKWLEEDMVSYVIREMQEYFYEYHVKGCLLSR